VDYIDCGIEEGLRYVDNNRRRQIIHNLFIHKRKGKIIYITATALRNLTRHSGKDFIELPFAIRDVIGVTEMIQFAIKSAVSLLIFAIVPFYVCISGLVITADVFISIT